MLGLDASGKTTILYVLKLDDIVTNVPTMGFNVETISYRNTNFTIWDVGGGCMIKYLWKHYIPDTDAIMYVIDSSDRERMPEACRHLRRLCREIIIEKKIFPEKKYPNKIIVLVNKVDINVARMDEVKECLQLHKMNQFLIEVQETSISSDESHKAYGGIYKGVYKAFDWLLRNL
jgi:ADP-ribosylation factor protein 1